MNLGRRRFLALGAGTGLTVAAGGSLTGCGGGEPALRTGGTLVVGLPAYPTALNPVHAVGEETRWVSDPVVERLYAYRDDTTLAPVLAAADPQISADGLVWTIRLRAGVTYAGGAPFDAHSVVACLTRVASPATAGEWAPYLAGRIGAVTAVDALTVRIELPKPFGILRQFLANLPVPHPDSLADPQALVGTGPFVVEVIEPGRRFGSAATANTGAPGRRWTRWSSASPPPPRRASRTSRPSGSVSTPGFRRTNSGRCKG